VSISKARFGYKTNRGPNEEAVAFRIVDSSQALAYTFFRGRIRTVLGLVTRWAACVRRSTAGILLLFQFVITLYVAVDIPCYQSQ